MRSLLILLACSAVARADLGVRATAPATLQAGGFRDGSGAISRVAVLRSRRWLAVVDLDDSCCLAATLVLHVLTERGKTVTRIPFGCNDPDEQCEVPTDRPRAQRFLRAHPFAIPPDAIAMRKNDLGEWQPIRSGDVTISFDDEMLRIESRAATKQIPLDHLDFAVYLPSQRLLVYRWYNPNIPESDDAYVGPYWGVQLEPVR